MEFVYGVNGKRVTVYRQAQLERYGKPPEAWTQSPAWLMEEMGWQEPRFVYKANVLTNWERFWENHFQDPERAPAKLLFWETFTDGQGPLTGPEVREKERRAGVMIDDHTAVSAYNNWQQRNQELYGGPLTLGDLTSGLASQPRERLKRVHDWVTGMLEAEPGYFLFETRKVISEDVTHIEGVPHVTAQQAGDVQTVGIVLHGRHAEIADVFNLTHFRGGAPNPAADGKRAAQLPHRKRGFRVIGTAALSTYMAAPHLVLQNVQVKQLEQGFGVTMERGPQVPGWVWRGGAEEVNGER